MKNEIISQNTKKALAASLKKIMQKKSFSKITVSEIAQDCGVNRNTFYYHFEDIFALLHWIFTEEAIEMIKQFNLLIDYEDAIRFIINYVENNSYIINCAYDSIGRDELKRFFSADFTSITASVIHGSEKRTGKQLEPEFREFLTKFYTEAVAGILVDFVKDKDIYDHEKIVQYLSSIVKNGLKQLEKGDGPEAGH